MAIESVSINIIQTYVCSHSLWDLPFENFRDSHKVSSHKLNNSNKNVKKKHSLKDAIDFVHPLPIVKWREVDNLRSGVPRVPRIENHFSSGSFDRAFINQPSSAPVWDLFPKAFRAPKRPRKPHWKAVVRTSDVFALRRKRRCESTGERVSS